MHMNGDHVATLSPRSRSARSPGAAMTRVGRHSRLLLAVLLGNLCRPLQPSAGPAVALTPWPTVFAAETDTVVALAEDGTLWRTPFHVATPETLWRPSGRERVARFGVASNGRDVAWLSRASDQDSTHLWVWYRGTVRLLAGFESLRPPRLDVLHYEPAVPTVEDRGARGGRFIRPTRAIRGTCSNAFAWTPDGGSVIFSADDGLYMVHVDRTELRRVSEAIVSKLVPLHPTPIYLARVFTGEHAPFFVEHQLLYPAAGAWRLFPAPGFGLTERWTADRTTVWWADGSKIRAVRAHDPTPTVAFQGDDAVVWLEYDPSRRCLAWASGRRLMRRTEGNPDQVVLETPDEIRSVIGSPNARHRGVFAGKDLLIWTPADDSTQLVRLGSGVFSGHTSAKGTTSNLGTPWVSLGISLGDRSPFALFEEPSGECVIAAGSPALDLSPGLLVSGGMHQRLGILPLLFPSIHRVEALYQVDFLSARLEPIPMPEVEDGRCFASPTASHVIVVRTKPWIPGPARAFDIETRHWKEFGTPTAAAGWLGKASAAPDSVVHAWDLRARTWIRVRSPGMAAWEPLAP